MPYSKVKKIIDNHIVNVLGADKENWFDISNPHIIDIIEIKLVVGIVSKDIAELDSIIYKCSNTWPKFDDCPVNTKLICEAFMIVEVTKTLKNMVGREIKKDDGMSDPLNDLRFKDIDIINIDKSKLPQ